MSWRLVTVREDIARRQPDSHAKRRMSICFMRRSVLVKSVVTVVDECDMARLGKGVVCYRFTRFSAGRISRPRYGEGS